MNTNELQLLKKVMNILESHFGEDLEIVLHDLTRNYDNTIIDIRNNSITNRQIGDGGDNLGLEVLSGNIKDGDRFNYVNYTEDNKVLKSSTIFIYNDNNEAIGSLCINEDITKFMEMEKYIARKTNFNTEHKSILPSNVQSLLDCLINEGLMTIGKHVNTMDKNDKLKLIDYLDKKGAFLITKSGDKVCDLLNISKFTLYNYLDIVRKNKG